jgi:hypothetical protein
MNSHLTIVEAYSYDLCRELTIALLTDKPPPRWKYFGRSSLGRAMIMIPTQPPMQIRMVEALKDTVSVEKCRTWHYYTD